MGYPIPVLNRAAFSLMALACKLVYVRLLLFCFGSAWKLHLVSSGILDRQNRVTSAVPRFVAVLTETLLVRIQVGPTRGAPRLHILPMPLLGGC